MNKFKYILFRLVLIIVALHTVISHPHSNELTREKHLELHKNANSLIGIIRLAFHESNDENLDNLVYTQHEYTKKTSFQVDKYPSVSFLSDFYFSVQERNTKKLIESTTNNFICLLFIKPNGLRGPPSLT